MFSTIKIQLLFFTFVNKTFALLIQSMKYLIYYLIIFLSIQGNAWARQATEEETERLDDMVADMEASMGTPQAEAKSDAVIVYATELDNINLVYYAMTTKLTVYLNSANYERLEEYADSIIHHCDIKNDETEYYYYYIIYLRSAAYIEQGKYRLALQYAQQLYNDGKTIPTKATTNTDEDVPQAIRNRCNALMCMGLANREMGLTTEALKQFDECIEIASPYQLMLTTILDAQTYKVSTVLKFADKQMVLRHIDEYALLLNKFKDVATDNPIFSYLSLSPYELTMHLAYVDAYCAMDNTIDAKIHLDKAQEIANNTELDEQLIAELSGTKSRYYKAIGYNNLAMQYADSAATYYNIVSKPSLEVELLKNKLDIMHLLHLYPQEYNVAQRIISVSDSLANQRYNSQIEEMRTIMDVDKLENETRALSFQRQLWVSISILVLLIALLAIILINRRRDKEKQRILSQQKVILEAEVARQTAELREQKSEIEQKNRDITDSINYAQRIQNSILPDLSQYSNYGIEGAFAFFIPCNIVSGDFYWATRHGQTLIIACSDCTGHGVPGAFVSMIGATSLNEICSKSQLLEPHEILEELDRNLMTVLCQSGSEARDGMDIVISTYNPTTHILKTSGARRPAFIFRKNGELEEYKGTKRSIGEMDENSRLHPFETQQIEIFQGDTLYMCSDGLADQFGGQEKNGPAGKRLMSGGLKRMMAQICEADITAQRDMAEHLYWEWRGTCPQLDDISLVGVRF